MPETPTVTPVTNEQPQTTTEKQNPLPLSKERFLEAAKAVPGVLDDEDRASLERRFNIKRPINEEKKPEEPKEEQQAEPKEIKEESKKEETPPEKSKEAPKMKLKIDGEEMEIDVEKTFPEFSDTWEKLPEAAKKRILAMHQKDLAASRRFSQASLTQKQLQSLITLLKEDPMQVLAHPSLNHNVRQVVENWLADQIQYEMMDPKEKELVDTKKKLQEKEELEKRTKEEAERAEIQALETQYAKQYQKEIIEAIDTSGLPKTAETVARIAYYLKEALKDRIGPDGKKVPGVRLKPSDVVDLVKEDYAKVFERLGLEAEPETLVKMFGEGFAEKFRKYFLAKTGKTTGQTPEKQPVLENQPQQKKKLSKDEWRKRNEERTR